MCRMICQIVSSPLVQSSTWPSRPASYREDTWSWFSSRPWQHPLVSSFLWPPIVWSIFTCQHRHIQYLRWILKLFFIEHLLLSVEVIRESTVLLCRLWFLHSLLHLVPRIWDGQIKVLAQRILSLLLLYFLFIDLPHQFILDLQFSFTYLVLFRLDCQVLLLFLGLFFLFFQILFYDLIDFVRFALASGLGNIFSGIELHRTWHRLGQDVQWRVSHHFFWQKILNLVSLLHPTETLSGWCLRFALETQAACWESMSCFLLIE